MKHTTFLLVFFLLFSCNDDPMRRARQAHAAENADTAEAAFNEVLKANPSNFEAKRLMADVHRFRGEFERAEKELTTLWAEKKFDQKGELSTEDSVTKRHMVEQFDRVYLRWVESIDKKKKPELFESVARKGLVRIPKSPTINRQLVEFYFDLGDRQFDNGKKLEAAATYEKVYGLIALPKQRNDASSRAKKIRSDVFAVGFKTTFETEILPKLKEESRWEPAKRFVTFSVKAAVDRKLNPKKPADVARAKKVADAILQMEMAALITSAGKFDTKIPRAALPMYKISEESFRRGKYAVTASVSLDAMMSSGFEFSVYLRKENEKNKDVPTSTPQRKKTPDETFKKKVEKP